MVRTRRKHPEAGSSANCNEECRSLDPHRESIAARINSTIAGGAEYLAADLVRGVAATPRTQDRLASASRTTDD